MIAPIIISAFVPLFGIMMRKEIRRTCTQDLVAWGNRFARALAPGKTVMNFNISSFAMKNNKLRVRIRTVQNQICSVPCHIQPGRKSKRENTLSGNRYVWQTMTAAMIKFVSICRLSMMITSNPGVDSGAVIACWTEILWIISVTRMTIIQSSMMT